MAYTKPYDYVDGTIVSASDQNNNDDTAKIAVNQKNYDTSLADATFDYDSFQVGELNPINNHHQFTTGEDYGLFTPGEYPTLSYFTSEVKPSTQTSATSESWTTIWQTGDYVTLEEVATMFFTFSGTFRSLENSATSGGDGKGKWDSQVLLRIIDYDGAITYVSGTRAYTFEETGAASAGSVDPGGENEQNRRFIGWQWSEEALQPGRYKFSVVINPKVEEGYVTARSYSMEIFYT